MGKKTQKSIWVHTTKRCMSLISAGLIVYAPFQLTCTLPDICRVRCVCSAAVCPAAAASPQSTATAEPVQATSRSAAKKARKKAQAEQHDGACTKGLVQQSIAQMAGTDGHHQLFLYTRLITLPQCHVLTASEHSRLDHCCH